MNESPWLGAYLARRAMRKDRFRAAHLVVCGAASGPLASILGESLTVYYCIDDYASYPRYG